MARMTKRNTARLKWTALAAAWMPTIAAWAQADTAARAADAARVPAASRASGPINGKRAPGAGYAAAKRAHAAQAALATAAQTTTPRADAPGDATPPGSRAAVPNSDVIAPPAVVLKDVVVTARRRKESAQRVPAPISTVSGDDLELLRNYRVQDLQTVLPSTNVAFIHARQSSVSVRGLGNNPANDGLEGSAGVYLDNVYLGRPGMAVVDSLDVEQIELLRGPQGTLFGKNSTAGILNITTRKPTMRTEASLEQSLGLHGYVQSKAVLSGPLSTTLAGRLVLYRTHEDGDVTNLFNGSRLNGGTREGVRGELLFKPSANLSARVIADYHREDSSYGTTVLYGFGPTINGYNPFLSRAASIGATPVTNPALYQVNLDSRQHVSVHQGGVSAEVNYTLPGGHTLTSISAARFWNFEPANDDNLNRPVIYNTGVAVNDHQLSQELRFASPTGGRIDYVLGAYYFHQRLSNNTFAFYGPFADAMILGNHSGALANTASSAPATMTTDSFALFAQGTWHATPRADVTAGIRGTYETKAASVTRNAPVGGAPLPAALQAVRNGVIGQYASGDLNLYNLSPSALLNVGYKLAPDVLAYATLSHGEKSGGVNMSVSSAPTQGAQSLVVGPERANNAELGVKSEWFARRLIVNANLFWTQVSGYQATSFVATPTGVVSVLSNAADVRSRGAELDLRAIPIRDLVLGVNASYVNATYTSYKNAPCPSEVSIPNPKATCSLSGRPVAGAPRWIVNLNAQYQFRLRHEIDQYIAAQYSLRSSQYGTLDDSQYGRLPGYGVLNLTTGWRLATGRHQWDLSIWARNVFDKRYYLASFATYNGAYTASVGDERMIGATLRYDY
ncbi:TonB-dependent receptor [Burkholderia singularis]|uniref:TonB-dependent receptor n=2 Tax=Burkholderia TaxID=32008 RepID=UPI0009F47A90|nr:TonB-dependent receptor [Burkholderia sp. Bp7605]